MHMKALILFIPFLFFFTHGLHAQAQAPGVTMTRYTDQEGLPQNSVKAMIKDREGFLWFTTEEGLVRFDGKHFRNFVQEFPALSSQRFHTILQDWRDSSFVATNADASCLRIHDGTADHDDSFLKYRAGKLGVVPWLHFPDIEEYGRGGIPDEINGLMFGKNDSVMLAGKAWLYTVLPGHVEGFYNDSLQFATPFGKAPPDRFFLRNDTLFCWGNNNTIYAFTGKHEPVSMTLEGDIPRVEAHDLRLYRSNVYGGGLLACTGDRWYNVERKGSAFVATLLVDNFNWKKNRIICALYDAEAGNLFLGSATEGLFRFSFTHFRLMRAERTDLDNVFYAQTIYKPGKVLTPQGHIISLDDHHMEKTALHRLINSDKYAIITDTTGFIWTKNAKTLLRIDPDSFKELGRWELPASISTLARGNGYTLYAATDNGTIFSIDALTGTIDPEPFVKLPVAVTCLRTVNGFLFASTVKGLYKTDPATGGYATIPALADKHINNLYIPAENEIWGTLYQQGFFVLRNEKLTIFPIDQSQSLRNSHCIVEDRLGYFWIPTNKGLFQAARNDLMSFADGLQRDINYRYYSTRDGLFTNEFNGGCTPCGLLLPDGWISLPSMNGLVWFNPSDMNRQTSEAAIFIDRVLVNGSPAYFSDTLHVSRHDQQIKILLSTPNWNNAENTQWQYAFAEGKDTAWFVADNDMVSLSAMSSGVYQLLIRKPAGFGKENYIYRQLVIDVPYGWYLHPVSLLCGGILGLLLVWGGMRLRIGYIKQQNRHLEQKIGEKTKELQVINRRLEASRSALDRRIQLQEKIIASVSHDVKSPMAYLKMITERIYEGLKQEGNSAYIRPMQAVNMHTEKLYYFMDNLLNYVKTQTEAGDILTEIFPVKELAEEKIDFFREMAEQKQTSFINNTSPGHFVACN
ncbi:MAG: hypothetical protein IT249_01880, partial [Chitinophagaceae bacterium]|nr:hypothetical protein [Chitinophagaceae bacterium]